MTSAQISVIIPTAPGETEHQGLARMLSADCRILEVLERSDGSRARSLNAGAKAARGDILWFLHADSALPEDAIAALLKSMNAHPGALHYFDLAFRPESGLPLIGWNAIGANLRSRLFGAPFGDQGFALRRAVFERVAPFPEDAPYGEDHLFVWRARQRGVRLARVGASILTSPRRYRKEGWLRLTVRYQYLWIKQALPEAWALMTGKVR